MHKLALILIAASIVLPQKASNLFPAFEFNSDLEEYSIYSIIINRHNIDESKLLFLIDSTSDSPSPQDLLEAYQQQREPYLSKFTLLDYRRKNLHPQQLTEKIDLRFPYRLLRRDEYEVIFKDGCSGWCKFFEHYPESSGYISLSRVGFDKRGTQALVYVAYGCGGLCGTGGYVVLAKEDGKWRIKKGMATWVS